MCAALAALLIVPFAAGQAADETVVFGIVLDGPWERNDDIRSRFEAEIATLLDGPPAALFPAGKRITADHTRAGVRRALDDLLNDPDVTLILALGPIASYEASKRGDLFKPVFAPFILNRDVQGILQTPDGTSGVRNLNYIDVLSPPARNVSAFLEITPLRHLTFLVSRSIFEALPDLPLATLQQLAGAGLEIEIIPVDESADAALDKLPAQTDGVYVTPLMMLGPGEFDRLVAGLIERRLPSFSLWGPGEVERGLLFTLTPDHHVDRLARRVALNVQRVLLGEAADGLKITFALEERLLVNMETARAIGLYPPWRVLTDAELINQDGDGAMPLTLIAATRQALRANRALLAEERLVAAGTADVDDARAALRPGIGVSTTGVQIDEDRAAASFGSASERSVTVGPSLSQVVYSDAANANLTIQKRLQRARERGLAATRLDVAAETATAFINVLRAETLLRIRRDNLRRTRSNLELARVRREIGASGPSEVFRWESEVALSRIEVLEAESRRDALMVGLNRLRHAPLEERIDPVDIGLDSEDLVTAGGRIELYVENPWTFGLFRDFMVAESIRNSPEIERLDASIAAQRRARTAARRAYWSPTGTLSADWTTESRSGVGADAAPPFPGAPVADDESWTVALRFSLPLYAGGARAAETHRAEQQLARLALEREGLVEGIEQRVRTAVLRTGSSFPAIELTREAAEAAGRTLELVTDAYSRGAVSILDLLDAQNAALVAELSAEDAVYAFLIDLVEAERAIGAFYFLMSPGERAAYFERLDSFYRERGAAPGP